MIDATIQLQDYNEEYQDFRSLMLLLHEKGYSSLAIGPLQQILNDLSANFSVDASKIEFLGSSSGEILMKEKPEVLFLLDENTQFVLVEGKESIVSELALEICCLAPDEKTGRTEIEKLVETIEKTAKIPLVSPITWKSSIQRKGEEKISKIVKGLSTNGKLLADIEIKKMCKNLRKDRTRKLLSVLMEIERVPFPFDSVEYLQGETGIAKKTVRREIKSLVDCGVLSPLIRLVCPNCKQSSPGFSVSIVWEELEGKIFCSHCGTPYDLKKQLEAFSVDENARQALGQGLWLEEFVADVLTNLGCVKVQVGVIVDTLEIDVIAIRHGEIILAECKAGDVNFTDLTIFSHKVRAIDPDRAVIITTSKVLPNAKKEIESIKNREKKEIMQIEGKLKNIREKLRKMVERIEKKRREDWINSILAGMSRETIIARLGRLRRTSRI